MKATNLLLWKTHECTNLTKPAYSCGGHPWTLQRIVMLWSVCALVCLRQHSSKLNIQSGQSACPPFEDPSTVVAGWPAENPLALLAFLTFSFPETMFGSPPPYLRIRVMWVMWSVPPTCLASVPHDPGERPGGQVYWTMWKWNAALSQNPEPCTSQGRAGCRQVPWSSSAPAALWPHRGTASFS